MSLDSLPESARALAARFAEQAAERATRRALDPGDFDALIAADYLLCAVPEAHGGWFHSLSATVRPLCDSLRILAGGDGCVALVAAMHPAVLVYWCLDEKRPPSQYAEAWSAQRARVFAEVCDGALWGTVTSEPGSGGDVLRTRARAQPEPNSNNDKDPHARLRYRLSGDKHFATGAGMSRYMLTTALPVGEERPDVFFVDISHQLWDGQRGVTMTKGWNAHGMMATQSHAFRFAEYPAERIAWPERVPTMAPLAAGFGNALFAAVILGILDTAMKTAGARMSTRLAHLRAYEQVAWQTAENQYWTACQVYEGMVRAVQHKSSFTLDTLRAKTVLAELAEAALSHVGRAMGGGAYTRYNPLGQWSQDVKALGFLRPPWGLAFDHMAQLQIAATGA